MFSFNRCKKWCGVLLLLVPIYEMVMKDERLNVEYGIQLYALCGIIMLLLPWFLKTKETESNGNTPAFILSIIIYSIIPILAASWITYATFEDDYIDSDEIEIETAEVVTSETVNDELILLFCTFPTFFNMHFIHIS